MKIAISYHGERSDIGQGELYWCIKATDGSRQVALERIELDPFILTGRDLVAWGLQSGQTLNTAVAILNHMCDWQIDAADMANRKPVTMEPIMNLYAWLVKASPGGFKLTDVDIIRIAWPGWRHGWRQVSQSAWKCGRWLRVLARKGPTGLRWHLNQVEVARRDKSPWMAMKIVLEPENPGTPFPKTFTKGRSNENTDDSPET